MDQAPSQPLRPPPLVLGTFALLIILIFVPSLVSAIRFDTDYRPHIQWAIGLAETGHFAKPIPQFLYHVILIAISSPIAIADTLNRFTVGAVILGLICYLWIGFTVFYWLCPTFSQLSARFRWGLLILLTLVIMLVGPINLLTWGAHNLYLGYLAANTYHNPTIVLLKPFGLFIFLIALRIFDDRNVRLQMLVLCVVVAALGVLAKPNYAIALLPALVLVALYNTLKKRPVHWLLLGAIIVPTLAVLAWQLFFYQTGSVGAGGFEFAPLKVMNHFSPDGGLLLKFILSIPFPAIVYLLYYRQARTRLDLNLAWLVFAVAAVFAYTLAESGDNWVDGNFVWGTQIALFILFIISVLFLVRQNTAAITPNASRLKLSVCVLVLILHLVGGIAFYIVHLTPVWSLWW